MKKILNIFFVLLGVIFFVILLLLGYLYFTTNLFQFVTGGGYEEADSTEMIDTSTSTTAGSAEEKDTLLSSSQAEALEIIGIDPTIVPAKFTDKQIECFEKLLGTERVAEIKAGSSPTIAEALVGKGCL